MDRPLTEVWQGAKYGYIWAGSNFCCLVFFYLFMPEMKGRSLEELDEIFAARVPARRFKEYRCHVVEQAVHEIEEKRGAAFGMKDGVARIETL